MHLHLLSLTVLALLVPVGLVSPARAGDVLAADSPHLSGDWGGLRTRLESSGMRFDVAYTGDFIENAVGGLEQGGVFLGNLDMTFTLETWKLAKWDLGTFFLYGLVNHGGKPSDLVGDTQIVDNIQAPTAAKIFELWWERAFLDQRLSLLGGLYDVNSEFYVVETAEIFLNSSFGMGAGLGASGPNGPSIFPNTSLAVRVAVEPMDDLVVSAAVMDGDPGSSRGSQWDLDQGDGIFFIAQVSRAWDRPSVVDEPSERELRVPGRRRLGREIAATPHFLKLALGTWLYSQPQLNPFASAVAGQPVYEKGHPGLYLLAEFDATELSRWSVDGLSAFVQLGWSDGDVNQFTGYTGAGLVYAGLFGFRPDDTFGVGTAIAYNGSNFDEASRLAGEVPAFGEAAIEFTYRTFPVEWFSIQGDLQVVIHPGGLASRPKALVAGVRFVVDL